MAETDNNKLNFVFTISDLASDKISRINEQWDTMKTLIGENKKYSNEFKNAVGELDSAFLKMKNGFPLINLGVSILKFSKDLYDARMESSKLEGNLKSLGLSAEEVGNLYNSALILSTETGISFETILSAMNKVKASFRNLNASDLKTLTENVANATLASGGNFSDLTDKLIASGNQVKDFNGDINRLNLGKFSDIGLTSAKLDTLPSQINRVFTAWNNFKILLGKGIEGSGLVKFGLIGSILKDLFKTLADGIGKVNLFLSENPKLAEFAGTFFMLGGSLLIGAGSLMVFKAVAIGFFAALKVAALSNPIGLAIVGIVAVIALVITYWDELKEAAISAWNWIVDTWSNLSGFAKLLIVWFAPIIGIPLLIHEHWDTIKSLFSTVGNAIATAFAPIEPHIQWFISIPSDILSSWNFITDFFGSLVDRILNSFKALPTGVKEILILAMVNPIYGIASLIWQALSNVIGNIRNRMKESGKGLFTAFSEGIMDSISDLKKTITSILSVIDRFLPHSNALEGPLSNLTGSGQSFVDTFSLGIKNGKNTIPVTVNQVMTGFQNSLGMAKESGLSFAKTVSGGVLSGTATLKNAGKNLYAKSLDAISNHSDAKEGPLANTSGYGRAFVNTIAHGIQSETPKINPVLQRFNQTLTPDSKGIVKRTLENRETSGSVYGNSKNGSNISIGSIVGQLIVGDRKTNKKKIGEILTEALFEELDRYEEMELA
ncbi:hypothetical protein JWG44_03780 [Leptospira sp. 201903071]|uniref:hypothetical protein n=1 Tax=Leptospira ainazelensis TaxID=2810034 RepID=UPI001965DBA2|nr:hypothetical protein [Leptospira ainazelensis]MBM9499365.1 hypothetical protein [Leptospira ainazelensis]